MRLTVSMQDPTDSGTTYLYEAILAAARSASSWRGFYAFATRDGVDQLIQDNIVQDLLRRGGRVDLVVGLDAITNRPALEHMQDLESRHPNFAPRVFWNESRGLFHPKISYFDLPDGGRTLIVGSGNLTPGGLRYNFEAYTIVTAGRHEQIDLSSLNEFVQRHTDHISPIDDAALERAAANATRPLGRARREQPTPSPVSTAPPAGFGRILLVQVPKAGDRWTQVHFNADVIKTYFSLNRAESERVFLTHVFRDGNRGSTEARPCVFSESNKNYKIEIGAAKGIQYPPDNQRPLIVFYEHQLRTYDYMLLMPDDDGYDRLLNLSDDLPSLGQGLPRHVTDIATLSQAWPDCPLLQAGPEDHQGL